MCKFSIAISASLLAFAGSIGAIYSQDAQEASAKAPIAFTGDLITSFEVKDVKAASKWYRDVLGCDVYLDLTEMGWCELTTPVTKSLIGLGHPEPGNEPRPSGGAKLSFGVESIDAALVRLKAHGVAVGEVVEMPGLVKLLEFEDPDGNRLMFHEDLSTK